MSLQIAHKLVSLLSSFSLLLQTFTPFLYVMPPRVFSSEPLKSKISYNKDKGAFNVEINTKENNLSEGKVEYSLVYKNDSSENPEQLENATDKINLTKDDFKTEIDAKTCSADGECVSHSVSRGILKLDLKDSKDGNWFEEVWFEVKGNEVIDFKRLDKGEVSAFTSEEEYWILKGTEKPTETPTPTLTVIEKGDILDEGIFTQITPTATVVPPSPVIDPSTGDELVTAEIVKTDGSYVDPAFQPEVWTDKADYTPTEKVVVSGKNFTPDYIYTIVISSQDPPTVTHMDTVTASTNGTFTYEYQLDGNYRPNYKVEVKDALGLLIASVLFTDSRTINWATVDNQGTTVNITVNVSTNGSGSNDDWSSTGYQIGTDSWQCNTQGNHTNDGIYTESFNIVAPVVDGVYDLKIKAYSDNSCTSGGTAEYLLSNAITVPDQSSLSLNETFGTDNNSNVPFWEEQDAQVLSGNGIDTPQSPGSKFAKIADNGWICKTIDASGYSSLVLDYYWRGDGDAENNQDYGVVEIKSGGACTDNNGWTNLSSHDLYDGRSGWNNKNTNISSTFNNINNLHLRFRTNATADDEYFRVDDVQLSGSRMAYCGDGVVQQENNEQCDDGNMTDGDGCSSTCQTEFQCGDGERNQASEQCDRADGVTNGKNFCSASCQLVPIYDGLHECPTGTIKSENPVLTKTISATDIDGETFGLTSGGKYVFEATGTFRPTNPSWYPNPWSDAGYTTLNGWPVLATQYGIQGIGNDYAAHALLADFGSGVGVVDWGTFNTDHIYSKYYEPTSGNVQFVIGDRYGDWFDTSFKNQGGMSDNQGSLTLNVYECQPIKGKITIIKDVEPNDSSVWDFTVGGPGQLAYGYMDLGDGQSHTFTDMLLGSYTITESSSAGYTTAVSCDNGSTSSTNSVRFDLTEGTDVTCTFINTKIISCGDGIKNGQEQCDGVDGVTFDRFCTSSCKLVPYYTGSHSCTDGSVVVYKDTLTLDSVDQNGDTYNLSSGVEYLFRSSGTYNYNIASVNNQADAAFGTNNNWGGTRGDIGVWGTNRGVTSILGDLGNGIGVIEWVDEGVSYDGTHDYDFTYTPSEDTTAQFLISDWHSNWYGDNCQNQSCMGDNRGSLSLEVFECKPASTVQVCKQDSAQNYLPGWEVGLASEKVDEKTINVTDGSGTNSVNLPAGAYLVKVLGTYRYGNEQMIADAGYSYRPNGIPSGCDCWFSGFSLPGGTNGLMARINGTAINWGTYMGTHSYSQIINHTGGVLNFSLYDNVYGDNLNNGKFHFEIYRIDENYFGTTGNDGCETFENVPLGTYLLDEVLQSGWTNVSGEGTVTVDDPTETFTLVNERLPGNLQVIKTVDWDGVTADTQKTFQICISGPSHVNGDCKTTDYDGETLSWTNLIPGDYTVTETDPGGGWLVSGTGTVTVSSQNTVSTTITNTANPLTIKAYKIVCQSEADLPNWDGSSNITEGKINTFLTNKAGKCALELNWDFQWGFADKSGAAGVDKILGTHIGPADGTDQCADTNCGPNINTGTAYGNWKTFGPTNTEGVTEVKINDIQGTPGIWVRESLKEGYVPFTYPPNPSPGSNVSAEIYCHTDVGKYDNYDQITGLQYGNTYLCVALNALNNGVISGYKWEDINANGLWENGEPALNDWQIFVDINKNYQYDTGDLLTTTDSNGYYEFNVPTGEQWIFEIMQSGWGQQVPYYTEGHSYHIVNVLAGQTYSNKNFGNYRYAHIEGDKWNDINGNGVWDSGEPTLFLNGLRYRIYEEYSPGLYNQVVDGPFYSSHYGYDYTWVAPGTYWVAEYNIPSGWTQMHPDSSAPLKDGMRLLGPITLLSGESSSYNDMGNTQFGKVNVTKYNDRNNDGDRDISDDEFNEEVLGGWEMKLSNEKIATTSADGEAVFDSLLPGSYTLTEILQKGWVQTQLSCTKRGDKSLSSSSSSSEIGFLDHLVGDVLAQPAPDGNMMIESGDIWDCVVGNYFPPARLSLSKFNTTWPSDSSAGSDVEYHLQLTVSDNYAKDLVVSDLPPSGFKYKLGSWKCYRNGILFACPEPAYASPGEWLLGDADEGDEFELIYTASIDGSQKPGLYKDLAWAYGCQTSEEECEVTNDDAILAEAVTSGTVDPGNDQGDNFVGSKVNLAKNEQESVGVDVKKEETKTETGDVLGASTGLPATGSANMWIIISGLLTIIGSLLMVAGILRKRKYAFVKYMFVFITLIGVVWIFATSVSAAPVDNLQIRLEQPKSPTRLNDFAVSYVAMDLFGQPLTVRCFMKKPSEGYNQLGGDMSVIAGGNSGLCPLTSSMINTNGTYEFYAQVTDGSKTENSEIITVDYNTSGPGTPSSYSKERISMCEYKISFKTSDDGQTTHVEIYRSENTSFSADSGTRVKNMAIGPNTNGTFNDIVPDCNKTYYYVLRAFDIAENGSGLIGDSVTVTTTTSSNTTTTTTGTGITAGAIPVTNVTLAPGETTGEVQGAGESPETETATQGETVENVLGEKTQRQQNPVVSAFNWILTHKKISLGVVALILGIIYAIKYVKNKNKTEKPSSS